MADINIEKKGPSVWLVLLAVVVVMIAVWLALRMFSGDPAALMPAEGGNLAIAGVISAV